MQKRIQSLLHSTVEFTKKRWKLLLILVIIAAGIVFFVLRSRAQEAEKNKPTFVPVERTEVKKVLELSGVVDAKEKARMRFAAGGKLVYLPVGEGDSVEKWQTIATIDRSTLQKQIEQDLNTYLKERIDWETNRDFYVENGDGIEVPIPDLNTRRFIQKEQLDLNNSVLSVEIRDIAIRDTVLSAPFAGIVTAVPSTTTGVQLAATDYFELVNPDSLIFRAFVEEEEVAFLRESLAGVIELDAFPDATIDSTIDFISFTSASLNNSTVYPIELPLSGLTEQALRLGMNGDVRIVVDQRTDTLSIPLNATRERGGVTYVDVRTTGDEFEERAIELGLETDDAVEVLSGLNEGEEVVLPE